ncbi:MAG: right-handed parallel beta-helix repeat-containing protein [Bacillota bacterium]|nr:right-handed parallel beta-helix repeat-containing protein [Bacillota bacterium]
MPFPEMNPISWKFAGKPYDLNSYPLDPDEVWEKLDAPPEEVRTALNDLINKLNSETAAASVGFNPNEDVSTESNTVQTSFDSLVTILHGTGGATWLKSVGVTGLTGDNVQTLLESLKEYIDSLDTANDQALANHKLPTTNDHDGRYYTENEVDGFAVKKTSDQTIAGVKTFSSSPIVPTPTTDMQASTKKYVDDNFTTKNDITNNRKLSATGDFKGTWNGVTMTQAEPGLSSAFNAHLAEIVSLKNPPAPMVGLKGDGITDETTLFQNFINAIPDGCIIVIPKGIYFIGNDIGNITLTNRKNLTFLANPDAVFSAYGGGVGNGNGFEINSCSNISFFGLTFKLQDLTRWNNYDNQIVIIDSNNIMFFHCVFGDVANKHIQIEGTTKNIKILNCEFFEGHFNSNPMTNTTFGGIHGYSDPATNIEDVTIDGCLFHNENLHAISFDSSGNLLTYPNMFKNINITNCKFENCTNGIMLRTNGGKICNNKFVSVGLNYIHQKYDFVTASSLNRYYSKCRSSYSGQSPIISNTLTPSLVGVFTITDGVNIEVSDNLFESCAIAMIMPSGETAPNAPYHAGGSSSTGTNCSIRNNKFDESAATSGQIYTLPFLWIGGSPTGLVIEKNNFILSTAITESTYLIRVNTQNDTILSKNTALNFDYSKIYYNSIIQPIFKNQASLALDFPSIFAFSTAELSVTVQGASLYDRVMATPNGAIESGLVWVAYVSSTDTIKLRLANLTNAAIDPVSRAWLIDLIK